MTPKQMAFAAQLERLAEGEEIARFAVAARNAAGIEKGRDFSKWLKGLTTP